MDKITFFDVEYANSKNKAICQMGILCKKIENKEPFYPELDIYVNPEDGFDYFCTRIHGITEARVEKAPNFADIWPQIEKYFTNAVIVGHNVAAADLDALVKTLRRYSIDIPEMYYIDTYELAKTYIQKSEIKNYSLGVLCEHYGIKNDHAHNAYYDANADYQLFCILVDIYKIDIDAFVHKYIPHEVSAYTAYLSNPVLRKKMTELYGMLQGFMIDNRISEDEANYLLQWKKDNSKYSDQFEIESIIPVIDEILFDGVVTIQEIQSLQNRISEYINTVDSSPITLATQILDGLMKGIIQDGEITEEESFNLRTWLYDNNYLSGHFPFDRLMSMLDRVLEDGILTKEESDEIMTTIQDLLNPVESTRKQVFSVEGKHICLSGEFKCGKKSDVEAVLTSRGAIVESSVKKTTDILIVGDLECSSYSNGSYGTKVKKAMEYNERGCSILIIKESDYFDCQ